jgi:DOPA 4,5-dioxygenase
VTGDAPFHAHIYYAADQRSVAAALREAFAGAPEILFAGSLTDQPVSPHPVAQFEVHFLERSLAAVVARIETSRLRALVHPLTDDDVARWIGEPLALDTSVLNPPVVNQGVARFGKSDF